MITSLLAVVLGLKGFELVLLGSQLALALSVVVLLLIWVVEWRNGRVW